MATANPVSIQPKTSTAEDTLQRKSRDAGVISGGHLVAKALKGNTQLLAWFGADVIKVEKAGAGDVTREQLRDIPDVDSLYFTMLNHNKRSVTLDTKSESGKQVLEKLVKHCDVLVENFAQGALKTH